MVGCIGSGKTTLSKSLIGDTGIRISQDEMGKKGHKVDFMEALELGYSPIVVDRMGFNKEQRMRYITPAREKGYAVTIFEFKTCPVVCLDRCMKREGHPNIPAGDKETAQRVIDFYHKNYEAPTEDEYDNINIVDNHLDLESKVEDYSKYNPEGV